RFSSSETGLSDETKSIFNFFSSIAGIFVFLIVFFTSITYFSINFYQSLLVAMFGFLFTFFSVSLTSYQASFLPRKYAINESVYYLINIGLLLILFYLLNMVSFSSVFLS